MPLKNKNTLQNLVTENNKYLDMKNKSAKLIISVNFEVYKSANDLLPEDAGLLKIAQKAVKSAYAPYSNFFVGSAVLLANGAVFRRR